MGSSYIPKRIGTIDIIVDDKMKVLRELCVVDNKNDDAIRAKLVAAIRDNPTMDMQRIVDRVARKLIYERFNQD